MNREIPSKSEVVDVADLSISLIDRVSSCQGQTNNNGDQISAKSEYQLGARSVLQLCTLNDSSNKRSWPDFEASLYEGHGNADYNGWEAKETRYRFKSEGLVLPKYLVEVEISDVVLDLDRKVKSRVPMFGNEAQRRVYASMKRRERRIFSKIAETVFDEYECNEYKLALSKCSKTNRIKSDIN